MAKANSIMLPLGTKAPNFNLENVLTGKYNKFQDLKGEKASVVMFICNHCPYVKHIATGLKKISDIYLDRGINFIAINSNNIDQYPEDSPEKMKIFAHKYNYNFPYLFDATQEVARAYSAACTPDFYLLDKDCKLFYRGQFDASRPGNDIKVSGSSLSEALDNIISDMPSPKIQYPSLGCNIKWK